MAVTTKDPTLSQRIFPEVRQMWTITVDHRATTTAKSMAGNLAGIAGPKGMCGLPIPLPDTFRLLDGDSRVLYEGRTNAASIAAASEGRVDGFEPLDQFGEPRGAKFIEYHRSGAWIRLKEDK